MPRLIMTYGLPGSGKSTWALEEVKKSKGQLKRVNKDDLRRMIDAGEWSKKNETEIITLRNAMVRDWLESGFDVVVDDTNLAPEHETVLRGVAQSRNAEFEVKDFTNVTVQECIYRDQMRSNSVGIKVILGMYNRYLNKKTEKTLSPGSEKAGLPFAVIFDMDGTLAHINGRDPYAGEQCETDLPNTSILMLAQMVNRSAFETIVVTGRMQKAYEPTIQWLKKYNVHFDHLFMRKNDDMRKDAIIKQEIYDAEIKDKFNIIFVVDDRMQVVEMWRKNGLVCLQCDEGLF